MFNFDCLVIGSGFSGSTAARLLADKGYKVLIVEERSHVGGNAFDCFKDGILIHPYGPHIFHTNEKRVFDFLSRFTNFFKYEHKVLGNIDGKLVPIPFNFTSIETLFSKHDADSIKQKLIKKYSSEKVSVFDLLNSEDEKIKYLGEYVYEKVFEKYTAKQWGCDPKSIDKSVINRVPVVLSYSDFYFSDKFQFMPKNGFTPVFNNMLNHKNIKIMLNTKAEDHITFSEKDILFDGYPIVCPIIFTGQIDRLLNYKHGVLPYRSLRFVFETLPVQSFQPSAVVNYNTSEEYTRITEFKKLTNQHIEGKTNILKEYPLKYNHEDSAHIPYYSINNESNNNIHSKYLCEVKKYSNFYCCGRLAEYKYYNMDKVISRAMDVVEEIINESISL